MKKILTFSILSLLLQFSILSQQITVSKKSAHSYTNDSLICLDKTAANKIMAERFDARQTISDQSQTIHILDSVAYNRGIAIDTLQNQLYKQTINFTASETSRVNDQNIAQEKVKLFRRISFGSVAVAILVAIIKFN